MATDFISRSEFDRTMQERYCFNCKRKGNYPIFGVACKACWVLDMLDELEQYQSADVVTREAFNRILAENDDMREQLAQIGKKPGDSMTGIQMLTCCCCDGSKVVEIDQFKKVSVSEENTND